MVLFNSSEASEHWNQNKNDRDNQRDEEKDPKPSAYRYSKARTNGQAEEARKHYQ
jgi:hypothetical protein